MTYAEFIEWSVFYGRRNQRRELAAKKQRK